jgi:plasmanylethanolamine desaturase
MNPLTQDQSRKAGQHSDVVILERTTLECYPTLRNKSEFPLKPIEVVSVFAVIALVVVHLVRFVQVQDLWKWPTVIAVLLGLFAADFVSGLLHWIGDTWGSEHSTGIGARFIRPFRFHHAHPLDMLKSHFFTTNGDTALGTLPFLLLPFVLPLGHPIGLLAAVFFWTLGALGMWTSQFHQWAHMKSPPRIVAWLQRRGLILSAAHHRRHHKAPFAKHYCITTGWCNPVLERIRFFPALEWAIARLTGARPRGDQITGPSAIPR